MDNFYKYVSKYLKGFSLHYTMSDEDVSGSLTTQIAHRDKYYTDLLKNHIKLTKFRGICKEIHKWLFFWLIIGASGIGIFYILKLFGRILSVDDINIIIDAIPIIIAALVSLVSTVITVPVTIAKFLFNTKEDDNITTLIKHTQKHDSIGMNLFKDRFIKRKSNKREESEYEHLESDDQ